MRLRAAQHLAMFPDMTVFFNLSYGLKIRNFIYSGPVCRCTVKLPKSIRPKADFMPKPPLISGLGR